MTRTQNIDFVISELARMNGITDLPKTLLLQEKQCLMRALMNIWQPQPLSAEFLQAQDRELQAQAQEKGIVDIADGDVRVPSVSVWQGDITRLQVDAIVNAANSQMLGCFQPLHACIDNAIHSAAGLQLRQECWEIMKNRDQAQTSEVIMTRGYNLPARYVLHTVGPIVPNGCPTPTQRQQLADCYTNCLDTIAFWNKEQGAKNKDNIIRSIAFCCISTGVFGYPQAEAAEVTVSAVKQWLLTNDFRLSTLNVIFCTFKDYDTQLYQRLL